MKLNPLMVLAAAALAGILIFKKATKEGGYTPSPIVQTNELPGYTFPEPGVVGQVTNQEGLVVADQYVVGTAQQAYDNAQSIRADAAATLRAAMPLGIISNYWQVQAYDRNIGQIPAGYGGSMVDYDFTRDGMFLDIGPHGWVVYAKDYSTLNPTGWANKYGSTSFGGLSKELPQWLTNL